MATYLWTIDGEDVHVGEDVELTPQTLTLPLQVTRQDLEHWQQYDRAGDLEISTQYGGAFRAVDRGGRDGPVSVEPPAELTPVFDAADYYVSSYEETQRSVEHYQVTLTLQRIEPRPVAHQPTDETDGDWQLELDVATIELVDEQVGHIAGSGTTTGEQLTIPLQLTDSQAAVLAESASHPDAVVSRSVPDGLNAPVDISDGRQRVIAITPSSASLPSATWLIPDWRLTFASFSTSRRWGVELTALVTSSLGGFGRGFGRLFGR